MLWFAARQMATISTTFKIINSSKIPMVERKYFLKNRCTGFMGSPLSHELIAQALCGDERDGGGGIGLNFLPQMPDMGH